MLDDRPKTKRLYETIQLVLTLVSTCAVVDTMHVHTSPLDRVGYGASMPARSETSTDRSIRDLARSERKRRESELGAALQQRQLRA